MYAVVRHSGKQHKVTKGDVIVLDRINGEVGSKLKLENVLMVRDDKTLTGADAAKATVTATVLEHFRGDKVLVFKYKAKKNYHRTHGHRSYLTKVRIEDIALGKPAARKKAKVEEPVEAVAEAPIEE